MPYSPLFLNRTDVGHKLAQEICKVLSQQAIVSEAKPVSIVYALPRGGLPVAAPVAHLIGCPLTVEVAKKISHPRNPELAIGAVTASGSVLWKPENQFRFPNNEKGKEEALNAAMSKAKSLEAQLIPACPQVNVKGARVIIVDDGIATGMTIAVAAVALRKLSPAEIWLCAPVVPSKLVSWLEQWGDRLIFLATPESFVSVSNFYQEFPQVNTKEAVMYLQEQSMRI